MTAETNPWSQDESTRHVRQYMAIARRPVLVGMGGVLFLYLLSSISFLAWEQEILQGLSRVVIVAMLVRISYAVAEQQSEQFSHAATASLLAGGLLGLVSGGLNLIWWPSWWAVLGLVAECLGGMIIGAIIGLLFTAIWRAKNKSLINVQSAPAPVAPVVPPPPAPRAPVPVAEPTPTYGQVDQDQTQPSRRQATAQVPARRRRSSRQQQ
ncbi:MAG: hypothetical protein AAB817_02320 [Patescibacteria group bacterium]